VRLKFLAVLVCGSLLAGGCAVNRSLTGAEDAACCVAHSSQMGLNLQTSQTNHFMVLSSGNGASAATTGRLVDQICQRFYQSFGQAGFAPDPLGGKLVLVCFDSYQAMEAYARTEDDAEVSWMDAYYSFRTNRVSVVLSGQRAAPAAAGRPAATAGKVAAFADPGAGGPADSSVNFRTLTHELGHQLAFNSGLQRRDVTYPFWTTEGLATNFEADSSGALGLGREEPLYRDRLVEAKARGRLVGLEQFVGMTELPAGGSHTTREVYAQAWGFFHYLFQYHPRELRQYMADLASPLSGSQSLHNRFVAAFGPIEPIEKDFLRFVDGAQSAARPAR
jgi:hypothetical protein